MENEMQIIEVLVKMAKKGMLRVLPLNSVYRDNKYGTISEQGEFIPAGDVVFQYLCREIDFEEIYYPRSWETVATINFPENSIKWNPEIGDPARLIIWITKKYNDANAKICEIEI